MMRQPKIVATILLYLLPLLLFAGCDSIEPEVVVFPDSNLEIIIREALSKPADEEILSTELARLKKLSIKNTNISDLTGLEYCLNLTSLEIRGGTLTDISPLSSLTQLTSLDLCDNQISDITPISNLTNLEFLAIAASPITDVSPLSSLTKLSVLDLADCQITDISPLASLENLTILCLQGNEVNEISAISHLSNLIDLRLTQNRVDDISPLLENSGLGQGDSILVGGNNLELRKGSEDMENIETLETRGITVSLDPQQWAPENPSPDAPQPTP
jgi:Leucine-rich repeat (LRR) protein